VRKFKKKQLGWADSSKSEVLLSESQSYKGVGMHVDVTAYISTLYAILQTFTRQSGVWCSCVSLRCRMIRTLRSKRRTKRTRFARSDDDESPPNDGNSCS